MEKTEGAGSNIETNAKTRILLANDNPFLLNSFENLIALHFDTVDTAENGLIAV